MMSVRRLVLANLVISALLMAGCTSAPATANAREATATPIIDTPLPTHLMDIFIEASATPTVELYYVFPIAPMRDASYQCGHHDYPALDIAAPIGSSFLAVTSGIVDSVVRDDEWIGSVDDPSTRGGLAVSIVGDDGVRYYGSHLSKIERGIKPGVRVFAGQVLGLTGDSGNAVGTPPHLHFGISHPTTPDDWVVRRGEIDPCSYVQAWAAGMVLTPDLGVQAVFTPHARLPLTGDE